MIIRHPACLLSTPPIKTLIKKDRPHQSFHPLILHPHLHQNLVQNYDPISKRLRMDSLANPTIHIDSSPMNLRQGLDGKLYAIDNGVYAKHNRSIALISYFEFGNRRITDRELRPIFQGKGGEYLTEQQKENLFHRFLLEEKYQKATGAQKQELRNFIDNNEIYNTGHNKRIFRSSIRSES